MGIDHRYNWEGLKELRREQVCDQACEYLQDGEDGLMTELEEMTRDGETKRT